MRKSVVVVVSVAVALIAGFILGDRSKPCRVRSRTPADLPSLDIKVASTC
jgi:hypothetical protein